MARPLQFRHRIGLLVSLAAVALIAVAVVTFMLGRRNEQELSGIEDRYVPLIELDRDLKTLFAKVPRALEDAAAAAEDTKIAEADALEHELVARLRMGAGVIRGNGGDAAALEADLDAYYRDARAVSTALMSATDAAALAPKIEAMRRAQQAFTTSLDAATSPDRKKLAAAFAIARETQTTALRVDIVVAGIALTVMGLLSWRLIRRTVRALHAVSAGVERLARGEFGQEIDVSPGDELGDLAREANRTAGRLRAYRERTEREDWVKTGLATLSDHIAGELDLALVATKAMTFVAGYIDAPSAAVLAADDDGEFRRLATHGPDGESLPTNPRAGERDVRVDTSDNRHIIVVPLVHESATLGVLELATKSAPSERELDLATRITGVLGTAFHVAGARERERELLVQTQRQALATETANKELEAFSYSVSHDLRAPLRGIDGFSQALLEDYGEQLPPKAQDYLRRVRTAAQRMAELIDDLLRLSRVSRADFRRERVDLSAIVATIVGDLRRAQADREVEVRAQPGVIATADPQLVKITLENLLGNAWKFTAKTTGAVIEFGSREQDGQPVYFVRDNGAGFDMKYADRLFDAFQRLHTDKEFPGTGIGLATVQRIVHRHGGRIWVEAEVAHGATFQFTLPDIPQGASAS